MIRMIGVFPKLYPDELLYSAVARFAARMRIDAGTTLVRTLFGDQTAHLGVQMPAYLDAFLSGFPLELEVTAEDLIARHTMLPFYASLLPPERVAEVKGLMRGNDARMIRRKIGAYEPPLSLAYLRYCPQCVDEDRATFGECYWRRTHQIPALAVCTTHEARLADSDVPAAFAGRRTVTAEAGIKQLGVKSLKRSSRADRIVLGLARSAVYLLGLPCIGTPSERLADAYRDLLFERDLLTFPDVLRATALKERMWECFPKALLEKLGTAVPNRTTAWPLRLLRPGAPSHPVYHLVFLAALDYPVEKLLPGSTEKQAGPGEQEVLVVESPPARANFERKFRDLREDPNVTAEDAATQLGLPRHKIVALVRRLNLNRSRKDPSYTWITVASGEDTERSRATRAEARKIFRARWQELRRVNREATRKDLAAMDPAAYSWLTRHDHDWYEKMSPAPRNYKPGTPPRHDWTMLDEELIAAAQKAREELLELDPPMRVTKAELLRRIGLQGWRAGYDLLQLPRLNAALDGLIEATDEYYPRRLRWAAHELRNDGFPVTRTRLRHLVPMETSWWHAPGVEDTINEVCER